MPFPARVPAIVATLLLLGMQSAAADPALRHRDQAHGQFEIHTWVDTPLRDLPGGTRMKTTATTQTFRGGITGSGGSDSVAVVRPDGTSQFTGYVRVTGRVGGRDGSFLLEVRGGFDGTAARSTWKVVPGTGSDGLTGLRGEGGHVATSDAWPFVTYTLTYRFE
ncbi:DUF3224 domain-containing protein [Lentzea kentuckyensis]|uniref:DUF3224 domain-containing protein n=1 Tax=Lentzea kentuckyensis TaxID=360086 RepID=UPI000A3943CA|nr:DUF3224 domain-containing protein [Lentzea kentuckyensis]